MIHFSMIPSLYFSTELFTQTRLLFKKLEPTVEFEPNSSVIKCNIHDFRNQKLRNPQRVRVSAEDRISQMQLNNFMSSRALYRSLRAGNYDQTLYLLESMMKSGFKPPDTFCTKLVKGLFTARRAEKAVTLMQLLEQFGEPSVTVYNSLISGFCKMNRVDEANRVLHRMRAQGLLPNVVTYNIIIGRLCERGQLGLALDQLKEDSNGKPTIVPRKTLKKPGIIAAMELLDEMITRGLQPDIYTYNAIVRGLCREGMVSEAYEFVRSLPTMGCKPGLITYTILLTALLYRGKWNDGEKVVKEMFSMGCKPDIVTYCILMSKLCKDSKLNEAINLLEIMIEDGLTPNKHIYYSLISAFCREGGLDLTIDLLDGMISNGCSLDIVNYTAILSAMCKKGNADQAMVILEKLRKVGHPLDASTYTAMMSALWDRGERTKALDMVPQMIDHGIDPDKITYGALLSCLSKGGMVDEACELLKDMESYGFPPTVYNYNNAVLLGLCKGHRLDEAIDILEEMIERGCRPTENTYLVLIELVGYHGGTVEAMKLAETLSQMNVISTESLFRLKDEILNGK